MCVCVCVSSLVNYLCHCVVFFFLSETALRQPYLIMYSMKNLRITVSVTLPVNVSWLLLMNCNAVLITAGFTALPVSLDDANLFGK